MDSKGWEALTVMPKEINSGGSSICLLLHGPSQSPNTQISEQISRPNYRMTTPLGKKTCLSFKAPKPDSEKEKSVLQGNMRKVDLLFF